MPHDSRDPSDRSLGLDVPITRQDFLNGVLLGAGALLLGAPAPASAALRRATDGALDAAGARRAPDPTGAFRAPDPWTGYGGTGDYAAAYGNTRAVLDAERRVRDGAYATLPADATDTGEVYDVIVVGGGIAGLTAAYTVAKSGSRRCLVLENHAIFGGQARQNEFDVDGVRLVAPQASDQFAVPREGSGAAAELWDELKLPREFDYVEAPMVGGRRMRAPLDHYAPLDGVNESQVDVAYHFDEASGAKKPTWLRNVWRDGLKAAPFAKDVKAALLKWRTTSGESTDEFRRHLDTLTYAEYLEGELGFPREVTEYVAPVVGLIAGFLVLQRPWLALRAAAARQRPDGPIAFALATGVAIAAYTSVDRVGTRLIDPIPYAAILWASGATLLVAWIVLRDGRGALRPGPAAVRQASIGGVMTLGAYLLILYALSVAPLTAVAPLRESATVVAAASGAVRLGEAVGRGEALCRIAGSVLIVAGAVLLALDG